ncbi:MAG: phage holin family protein [candidate division NC10 bacterium]|nr:phage holin family protein [candidate division NC10 bacterium]
MRGILIRWLVLTLAILATAQLLDGIRVSGFSSAVAAAAILGILNALLRPVLLIVTLPINILTFGLFTFVINALLLLMASGAIPGFEVGGFWAAVGGSIVISLVSWLLNSFIGKRGTVQYVELRKTGPGRWE